jgi:protein TonB
MPKNIDSNYAIAPDTERFIVSLFVATLVHIVIIYGFGFSMPTSAKPLHTTMEIILVQKSTDKAPDKADYLAQVNHEGSGEYEKKARPVTPTIAPFPDQIAEIVVTPPPPQIAATLHENHVETVTTNAKAKHQVEQHEQVMPTDKPSEQGNASQTEIFEEYISENTLLINARLAKLASIQAELDEKFEDYTKSPRLTFLNSSTKKSKYASYMDGWRHKIEEMGTKFYREQNSLREFEGSLMVDVALNPNGTIRDIDIKKASKHKVLDDAALQIVHSAAPFEPFSDDIRKETDILHITRTWEFRYNNFVTKNQ